MWRQTVSVIVTHFFSLHIIFRISGPILLTKCPIKNQKYAKYSPLIFSNFTKAECWLFLSIFIKLLLQLFLSLLVTPP